MDPRLWNDTSAANIMDLCYNGLTYIDPEITPQPDLAVKWETVDPTTWVFTLQEGVTFRNGNPFTAEDVKFTIESMIDPAMAAPKAQLYTPIESIEVQDDHTVQFTLSAPYAPLLAYLYLGIVSKSYAEDPANNLAEAPMGTGPFKFVQWDKNNRITLEAFDDYFKGRPPLDQVILHTVPDNSVKAIGIESGTLDLIQSPMNAPDVKRLASNSDLNVTQTTGLGITFLNINITDPILSDRSVRQALAWLTDRETIAATIYEDMDSPQSSILIPGTWWWDESVNMYSYDPERAQSVLDEAGWTMGPDGVRVKDGQRLSLRLTTYNDPNRVQLQQFLQNAWQQAGIEVTTGVSEWPAFSASLTSLNYQVGIIGLLLIVDPDYAVYRQYLSTSPTNVIKFQNAEVDNLLMQGREQLEREDRKQTYAEIARHLLEESPVVYSTYQGYVCVTRKTVNDYVVNRSQSIKGIERAWLS